LVEVLSGGLLALAYWHYGLTAEFAISSFYFYLFIVIAIIDLEHRLILNKIVYPAAVVALIIAVFFPPPGIFGFSLPWPWAGIANSVIGGAIGFAILLIPTLVSRGGMGWGDVKMAALIGLVAGFQLVFVALLMGIILGGLVASVLLLLRIKKRKEAIPFGPFLSLATIATLLFGNDILGWYLGLY